MNKNKADLPLINQRLQAIEAFLAANGYESYDPYDGLLSPLACKFVGENRLGLRLWQQTIRLSPLEIRPLLGIHKMVHTKAISDFASAFSWLSKLTLNHTYKEKALFMLERLSQLNSPSSFGIGWGLRFPFVTRFVDADEQTCNIFQTINAIHAFLDGYRVFRDPKYLEMALRGFEFAEKEIGYKDYGDYLIWNYWKGLDAVIYNVNGLMIGLTARLFSITGDERYTQLSRKLCIFIGHSQNQDGSWFYSADSRGQWVDGYHTGYILEGLFRAVMAGIIDEDNDNLRRGVQFYLERMFTEEGLPEYYPGRFSSIDVQNGAQAIQTLVFLAELQYISTEKILSTIQAVDAVLWNPQGYYNHMKSKLFTYTTPMHRWSTGPMFLALVYAKRLLEGKWQHRL